MRLLLLANPHSGKGLAIRLARRFADALAHAGHHPTITPFGPGSTPPDPKNTEAIVVFGGDGSIHHAAALAGHVPLYHVPLGNENLFAREFHMTRHHSDLLQALRRARPTPIDTLALDAPTSTGTRHALIMLSLGPDAAVVERLHRARRGPAGHLAYLAPILAQSLRPSLPTISLHVDGTEILRDRRGWLVVANLRRYALAIDPAAHADPDDGLLDAVFMPAESSLAALAWAARCRLRLASGAVRVRGRVASIHARDAAVQIDGECAGRLDGRLDLAVRPASLRVLTPR
ncbi:MAG: hypothetical protein JNM80_10985 [Phycisphaerae bacterium]|nr:hypothetical protein [Phycisphaerae bacterium]